MTTTRDPLAVIRLEADMTGGFRRQALLEAIAQVEALVSVLRRILPYTATQAVGCHGNKCREPWCYSCCGEDDAYASAEIGLQAFHDAHTLLKAFTPRQDSEGGGHD